MTAKKPTARMTVNNRGAAIGHQITAAGVIRIVDGRIVETSPTPTPRGRLATLADRG